VQYVCCAQHHSGTEHAYELSPDWNSILEPPEHEAGCFFLLI